MSLYESSNDRAIQHAMVGPYARRDCEILQNQLFQRKLKVELDENYKPIFSIDQFVDPSNMPSDTNYEQALRVFKFHCQRDLFNIGVSLDSLTKLMGFTFRDGLQQQYNRIRVKHGDYYFRTIYLKALIESDWPEKRTPGDYKHLT